MSSDASEKIVELLNYATLEPDSGKKLDALRTVQELLLHKVKLNANPIHMVTSLFQ